MAEPPFPNGHIAIRLQPGTLRNPDADIRYHIPDLVAELTSGTIRDNGYDYTDDDTMIVYLACDDPSRDVNTVIDILRGRLICGNAILDTAVIGISVDGRNFDVVHPMGSGGQFTVDPW